MPPLKCDPKYVYEPYSKSTNTSARRTTIFRNKIVDQSPAPLKPQKRKCTMIQRKPRNTDTVQNDVPGHRPRWKKEPPDPDYTRNVNRVEPRINSSRKVNKKTKLPGVEAALMFIKLKLNEDRLHQRHESKNNLFSIYFKIQGPHH